MQRTTPHLRVLHSISHNTSEDGSYSTPSESQSTGVYRLRFQISSLFYPKNMLPISGHSNRDRHRAEQVMAVSPVTNVKNRKVISTSTYNHIIMA